MFVQPLFLYLMMAAAIPLVIHLLFRQRSRQVPLGTLRFLKVVLHENARRRRLKQLALLALRMLGIVLLASLFARPYLPALASGTAKDRFIAVLVDRSASMQLADDRVKLIDRAVAAARDLAKLADRGTEVQIAFFDHTVEPVTGDMQNLLDLKTPSAFGATNYGAALAWARDVCVKAPHARKEVHLFTDLQQSGLDWTSTEPLPPEVALHLHDLGREVRNNVAIIGIQTSQSVVRPGETATIQVSVLNGGPFPLEKVPVTVSLQGAGRKQTLRQSVSVEPGATGTVDLETPPLPEGFWQGLVKIELDDELSFDNQRHMALFSAPPMPVVLVDGDPREAAYLSETYYLDAALRLAPPGQSSEISPFAPEVVRISNTDLLPELTNVRVVVLANVGRLPASDAARLGDFVKSGGGLVVFTGEQSKETLFEQLQPVGLTPGAYLGQAQTSDLPWRLAGWDEKHALFEPFNDPQTGDLRRLTFRAFTRIEADKNARVLATFQNGEPAAAEVTAGKGRAIWILTSCDRDWSDWPRSRLYVPFVHQTLGSLTGLTEGGPVREVLLDTSASTAVKGEPGVIPREGWWDVVNVSPRESEMERSTPEDFARRFEVTLHQKEKTVTAQPQAASLARLPTEVRDDEVWPWINVLLVIVMLGEVFLANRTMV